MKEENKITETEIDNVKTRMSRSQDSRAFESRIVDERPPIVFGSGTRFNVPKDVMKDDPDYVYGFVVYSSSNEEQQENYWNAVERGWKAVPAIEHPSLCRNYEMSPFKRSEDGDQLIRRGGQVLMKRRIVDHNAELDFYDSEKRRQEYMAEMFTQTDSRYPKPFLDERKRVRMRERD